MLEHRSQPLLPFKHFIKRLIQSLAFVLLLIAVSLVIGMIGYHITAHMNWIDSLYNASLILSGMGPASELHSKSAKIFASCYSLYSGLLLIAVTGMLLAPIFHRIMHKLHIERKDV